ncbi:Rgp1-domain-containing protein [Westerdykella ornata]|uniref:Rgp1-domain-containing protein n=1 Tax=Westerdykella ornata TaxID=318751 RepID=A0A6A6JXY3_WESOR|nr:Rgp1-domain-containing protein [Westerdykella ornata]KAF2281472.1 Rgp1-domain-containing protein [Westerdykella ornata]
MSSTIRVFVQWKESTVFAGEDIECTITFKNVAVPHGQDSPNASKHNSLAPGGERQQRKIPPVQSSTRPSISRNSSFGSGAPPPHLRGHRPALSLATPSIASERRSPGLPNGALHNGNGDGAPTNRHNHQRSLSIISLGAETATEASHDRAPPRRPRGHARSASLQVVPGRPSQFGVVSPGHRSAPHHSPLAGGGSSSPPTIFEPSNLSGLPPRQGRRTPGASTGPSTPALGNSTRKSSNSFSHSFKFPAAPPSKDPSPERPQGMGCANTPTSELRGYSPRPPDGPSPNPNIEVLSPVARILSGSSMNGTPRSSGEFYSMSNNSSETLASEYVGQPPASARLLPRPFHQRASSQLAVPTQPNLPETLMMGYAQIVGSFTLDGSLINQAPFEEVKRKGVVGGQGGGGVVGVERKTRDSGLFGALGWGNLGESIGGLLRTSEPSSIREMRGIASSKTVPLITTPQSILFVDLKLSPGESRSYSYSFTLPKGLPPTHKGRSIKVSYHLSIGTQRPGSARNQSVRQVEIPFRVFGSVNTRGEILGHDLMSPYIILRDQARTSSIPSPSEINGVNKKSRIGRKVEESTFNDFLEYVDNLLERPRQNSSMGLLSPTGTTPGRPSIAEAPQSMKEAIDLAILRSNLFGAANQSANRFEIARSGRRVAVIMLARPAYRLGETISLMIDFTETAIPTYFVHVSLETSEKVDPAIALRSNASIYRVTRKVHASFSENALFAQRLSFSPTIPPNSTPEFITSGVSLEWRLRIEFITPRLVHHEDGLEVYNDDLLEEVTSDDRGVILAAAERLHAESFEVQVPVRVYGAVTGAPEAPDEEGLPV